MTDRLPRACFPARSILKSTLAEILPAVSPSSRLELFAREAGHRSDAAFEACQLPIVDGEALKLKVSRAAASGRLLPLLAIAVTSAASSPTHCRATAREKVPEASEILRKALPLIDLDEFASTLYDPRKVARSIDAPPVRWLYAVAVSEARLRLDLHSDKFWVSKAREALIPFLFFANEWDSDARIEPSHIRDLRDVEPTLRDPWTLQSHQIIRQCANTPEATMKPILLLVNEAIRQRRQWWVEADTHNVGIGPGSI